PFTEVKLDEARVGQILDRVKGEIGDEAPPSAEYVKKKLTA
ncbi:MAG: magnesium chelatase ATPase subunit I, partial [Roseiflexus castenholzii]